MIALTVLSRSYCHLCDDMIAALEEFRGRFSLAMNVDVIDIDGRPDLEARWGDKVPVLLAGETEIFHYFFDQDRLQKHIGELKVKHPGGSQPENG